MHGVKRVRQSAEVLAARKQKEQAKLKEYLVLVDNVMARKKSKDWSKEAFDLTTRLLQQNPEFYTVWNYRRNILINGLLPTSTSEESNDFLSEDLIMTMAALKAHPKVYWIWNHRRWCLEQVPDGPGLQDGDSNGWKKANWTKELFVVEKMLDSDSRNFLAWNYRRYVLENMPIPPNDMNELAYTTRKIESNFSNFSAWHQRSKILLSLWNSGKLDKQRSLEDEFDLVRNAMYTDPNDQSVWIYHRWLVGSGDDVELLQREISAIKELLNEQPDSKWCMESLVHYKRLLLRKSPTFELVDECARLLLELQDIDPSRVNRYKEICDEIEQSYADVTS